MIQRICRFIVSTFLSLALCAAIPLPLRAQDTAALPHVKLALNPKFSAYLPIFVAVDKGYFKAAGVDVQIVPFINSSNDNLPALLRGDIDMMPILASPAFFNGYQNGIILKPIASTSQATTIKGYADVQAVMVRKDLWDSKAIRKLSDLRGKNVDGGTRSSALHVLALQLLAKANLTRADVNFTNKSAGPADQYVALANKAVDVQTTTEPNATNLQVKGLAVKWLSAADVMPWFQDSYLATTAPYLAAHRDVVQRLLNGYVRGIADVQRSKGKLTPELIATLAKWADSTPEVVSQIGGVPYFGQNGAINVDALKRLQTLWIGEKLVQNELDINTVYDDSLIKRAKAAP